MKREVEAPLLLELDDEESARVLRDALGLSRFGHGAIALPLAARAHFVEDGALLVVASVAISIAVLAMNVVWLLGCALAIAAVARARPRRSGGVRGT